MKWWRSGRRGNFKIEIYDPIVPDLWNSYEKITHLYKDGNLLAHDAWNERPTE